MHLSLQKCLDSESKPTNNQLFKSHEHTRMIKISDIKNFQRNRARHSCGSKRSVLVSKNSKGKILNLYLAKADGRCWLRPPWGSCARHEEQIRGWRSGGRLLSWSSPNFTLCSSRRWTVQDEILPASRWLGREILSLLCQNPTRQPCIWPSEVDKKLETPTCLCATAFTHRSTQQQLFSPLCFIPDQPKSPQLAMNCSPKASDLGHHTSEIPPRPVAEFFSFPPS